MTPLTLPGLDTTLAPGDAAALLELLRAGQGVAYDFEVDEHEDGSDTGMLTELILSPHGGGLRIVRVLADLPEEDDPPDVLNQTEVMLDAAQTAAWLDALDAQLTLQAAHAGTPPVSSTMLAARLLLHRAAASDDLHVMHLTAGGWVDAAHGRRGHAWHVTTRATGEHHVATEQFEDQPGVAEPLWRVRVRRNLSTPAFGVTVHELLVAGPPGSALRAAAEGPDIVLSVERA